VKLVKSQITPRVPTLSIWLASFLGLVIDCSSNATNHDASIIIIVRSDRGSIDRWVGVRCKV
jgi:hypothetical protein